MPKVNTWNVSTGAAILQSASTNATDTFSWIGNPFGSWASSLNWQDVTAGLNPAPSAPGPLDPVTITGPNGPIYEVIAGGGTSASLTMSGYVALTGIYTTGAVTLGSVPAIGSAVVGGLALTAGSELTAGSVTIADGVVWLNGSGASLAANGLVTVGFPFGLAVGQGSFQPSVGAPGTLAVTGGGTLTAASGIAAGLGLLSASGAGSTINVTGDVTIGTQASTNAIAPYTFFNSGSLIVASGASLTVSGSVVSGQGPIMASGSGSSLRIGGPLVLDTSQSAAINLAVSSGATVQADGLLIERPYQGTGYSSLLAPQIAVDGTAVLEIGSAGGAAAGALTIDAGQTLTAIAPATVLASIVNQGAIVQTGGPLTLSGSIVNDGSINVASGTLTVNGALSGPGEVLIGPNASVVLNGPASAGTVSFAGAAASLTIGQAAAGNALGAINPPPVITSTLAGFVTGDSIILPGDPATSADWTSSGGNFGMLSLLNGSSVVASYTLAGNYAGDTFLISPTTSGGGAVTLMAGAPVTNATVAQALSSYAGNPNLTSFAISDTALAVGGNLDALQAMVGAIAGFTLTDGDAPSLPVSWPQLANDAAVLALLPGGYTLVVNGVPAGAEASVQADPHVTSFSISDSSADVAAAIGAFEAQVVGGELDAISLTGGGTPNLTLSLADLGADAAALAKIAGPYNVTVTETGAATTLGLDLSPTIGGAAEVIVEGGQAVLANTGGFMVGDMGGASLSILSGGTIITDPGSVGGLPGLVIGNGVSAASSSVDVSGIGSRLSIAGLLVVGAAGSGVLQISDGAIVTAQSLDAGGTASSVGQISLSGTGSGLSIANAAIVGDDGTGVLSVLSGATFAATNLTIGNTANSSGALIVSGAGSAIDLSGALNIGTSLGTGDLTVGPGATVHASVVNLLGQVALEGGLLDPTVQLVNPGQSVGGFGTIAAGQIIDEGVIEADGEGSSRGPLVVRGTVLGGGTLTVNGESQGANPAGVLRIGAGGTLELTGPVLNAVVATFTDDLTATGTYTVNNGAIDVSFADTTGALLLDDIEGFAGTIAAYHPGDSFVISGGMLSGLAVSNGDTLTIQDSGAAAGTDRLVFDSPVTAAGFSIVNSDTVQAACFAAGTRIETERGPIAVESLRIGDRLVTADSRTCEPIVWIGHRAVNCERHPRPSTVWPVRVRAGAFGAGRPARDLLLSPDHAVFVNDVLVPVKLLVDGVNIAQERRATVRYFHVELPRHAVILAEGLPVESYLDTGDRANFDWGGAVIRLFPDFPGRLAPGAALMWETLGVAPLVMAGEQLDAARRVVARHRAGSTRPARIGREFA